MGGARYLLVRRLPSNLIAWVTPGRYPLQFLGAEPCSAAAEFLTGYRALVEGCLQVETKGSIEFPLSIRCDKSWHSR